MEPYEKHLKRVLDDASIEYIVVEPGNNQEHVIRDMFKYGRPVMPLNADVHGLLSTSPLRAAVVHGGTGYFFPDLSVSPKAMYINVDHSDEHNSRYGYTTTHHEASRADSRRFHVDNGEKDSDDDDYEYMTGSSYLFTTTIPTEWNVRFSEERYESPTTACSKVMDAVMAKVARKLSRAEDTLRDLLNTPTLITSRRCATMRIARTTTPESRPNLIHKPCVLLKNLNRFAGSTLGLLCIAATW